MDLIKTVNGREIIIEAKGVKIFIARATPPEELIDILQTVINLTESKWIDTTNAVPAFQAASV